MKIYISEVLGILKRLSQINKLSLKEIEWLDDNGKVVDLAPEILEEFELTGLSNKDFVRLSSDLKMEKLFREVTTITEEEWQEFLKTPKLTIEQFEELNRKFNEKKNLW